MAEHPKGKDPDLLPSSIRRIREIALKTLGALEPAGQPKSPAEARGIFLSSRTDGGRDLPPYYLVYLLLVDLLGFRNLGQSEKVAWSVPVRFQGRLYVVEYRKMGLGIFAPTLNADAGFNAPPTEQAEADARAIAALIKRAVTAAEPYFEWRAEQAAGGHEVNVVNNSSWLFERYELFRDRFKALSAEAALPEKKKVKTTTLRLEDGTLVTTGGAESYALIREAEWNAQAAVEAFFSWTEHVFIHLAILQGSLRSGADVAAMAGADWKTKFQAALDINDSDSKEYYDKLLDLRAQIRNFMAHGAFGKRGQAFSFHTGTGAIPVLLTDRSKHRYAITGQPAFDEGWAIAEIEKFIAHLWSGTRSPARLYIESSHPSILTYVANGTYSRAMQSEEDMKGFVDYLTHESDTAANMDW